MVAIGLGDAVAATGSTALVVEMDVREPELAARLGIQPSHDLSTALRPGSNLSSAVTAVPGRDRLSAVVAPAIDNARVIEQISSRGPGVVETARRLADCAIIDTAALGEVSDSLSMLEAVDEFVIVVRFGRTGRADLASLRSTLARAGLAPAGFVLVGAERVTLAGWRRDARSRRGRRSLRRGAPRPQRSG
jgi:non-specific protein-tyrosine kinase